MANVNVTTATLVRGTSHSARAPLGICECDEADAASPTAATTFSTPIPAIASQVHYVAGSTVQVTGGTEQTLASTRYYYFVSDHTSTTSGQSLLHAIKLLLQASLGGVTWTVVLAAVSGIYKIRISHNSGSDKTITFGSWASNLGFDGTVFTIASGATLTADWPSVYWWTPDQPVSSTGPDFFDVTYAYGVPTKPGFTQRAPDMTGAFGDNGEVVDATYVFNLVTGYYKIRKHPDRTNESLEVWWQNKGKRLLWWRNRDNATGSSAPSGGSSSPYNYIEYQPTENVRSKIPAKAATQNMLVYWDVTFDLSATENGEAILGA